MTDPFKRFRNYYTEVQDPYGNNPRLLQDSYAPEVAITPTLFGMTVSMTYPLAFIISASGGRIYPIIGPFDQPVLPGQGVPRNMD